MTTQQTPGSNDFDGWTETESATLAPPPEAVTPKEVPVKKAGRAPKAPMGAKQKKMLLYGGGALALVVAFMMTGKKDPPSTMPSADVAAMLAQAGQSTPGSGTEPNPFAGFEDMTPDAGTEASPDSDPTLVALNADIAGDSLVSEDAADRAPVVVLDTPPVPAPVPAPLPAPPVEQAGTAADAPPTLDAATRRRIEGLEGDLKRAQAARRAAERNQRAPVTVVAVLDDGVVVRDSRGRETVFAVGEQVK